MKAYQAIILSLLCHGILLLPLAEQRLPEVAIAPIQVTIGEGQLDQVSTSKPSTVALQPKPVKRKEIIAIKESKTDSSLQNVAEQTEQYAEQDRRSNKSNAEQQTRNYVLSRLHSEIDNYFFYPVLAIRKGWQGKVLLGLSVNSHGNIRNVHIKEGSGYKILDQSALDTLLKIKQIKSSGDWIVIDDLDIIIPVIYRLQKG